MDKEYEPRKEQADILERAEEHIRSVPYRVTAPRFSSLFWNIGFNPLALFPVETYFRIHHKGSPLARRTARISLTGKAVRIIVLIRKDSSREVS